MYKPEKIDMSLWAVFLSLCETESMGKTAAQVGCTTSTVSRKIGQLESQFGMSLFVREPRRCRLTDEGVALRDAIAPVHRLYGEHLQEALYFLERLRQPKISVATVSGLIPFVLECIEDFQKRFPQVDVSVKQVTYPREEALNDADFAIWADQESRPQVDVVDLGVVESIVVASAHYGKSFPRKPGDLRQHTVIQSTGWICPLRLKHQKSFEFADFIPGSVITMDTIANMVMAVERGMGIGVAIPRYAAREGLKNGTLKVVLPEYAGPSLKFRLLSRRSLYQSEITSVFRQIVIKRWEGFVRE